jgi:hypothetical protein
MAQADEARAAVEGSALELHRVATELEAARKELTLLSGGGKEMRAALERAEDEAMVGPHTHMLHSVHALPPRHASAR